MFNIVPACLPAVLISMNYEYFEIISHEIEYCNELTMSFVDLVLLWNAKIDNNPLLDLESGTGHAVPRDSPDEKAPLNSLVNENKSILDQVQKGDASMTMSTSFGEITPTSSGD
jgi:hypothetical protein